MIQAIFLFIIWSFPMFSLFWFKLVFLNLPSPSLFSFYNLILYLSRFYFNFKYPFELLLRLLQRVIYNSWLLLNLLLQNDYSLGFTSTFDPQWLCVFLPKESETVFLHFVFESTFFVLELFNLSNSHNNYNSVSCHIFRTGKTNCLI